MTLIDKLAFSPLTPLLHNSRVKFYPKNQILLYGGDTISELYVLQKGIVKIYDIDRQGNEKILYILKPPAILPITYLTNKGQPNEWFYGTITDCNVHALPYDQLKRQLETDDKLALYLMQQQTREMHELLIRVSSLGKTETRDKLLYVLRFLAIHHARKRLGGWRRVNFPVSHQLLADMIGMTRESTALGLKALRAKKIVRNPKPTVLEIHFDNLTAMHQPV